MDLIDRQAAIDALADMHCKSDEDGYIWIIRSDAWARIDALPSVTPKQKTGKWEEKAVSDEKVIDEWQSARCSACGKYHTAPYMYYFNNYNYCPNCGARMTDVKKVGIPRHGEVSRNKRKTKEKVLCENRMRSA